ncbi:MAG: hypothetical protein ABR955_14030 [Verrucomicrobiota bacterium]|jgi:hypothetical protein
MQPPVPVNELVACCYWEYARESARIRAAFEPDEKVFFPDPIPTYTTSPGGVRLKTGSVLNTARAQFIDQIHEKALPVLKTVHLAANEVPHPFDVPWLELSAVVRQAAVKELEPYFADKPALTYLPFNRCSDHHDIGIADADYRCAAFDAEFGIEYLRVQIDWRGFTDAQIIEAFKTWLVENRRVGVADRRGVRKQKGYGDNLAWLGIMRLMNAYPFTGIEKIKPDAWLRYKTADWPRARKKAFDVFKGLFPFLPQEDVPMHWQTAGRRAN